MKTKTWTTEKPTEPGFYPYREPEEEDTIVQVFWGNSAMLSSRELYVSQIQLSGAYNLSAYDDPDARWGPKIEMPEE